MKLAAILASVILVFGLSAAELSGHWLFESKDGLIRARLELREEGSNLHVTFRIDNHVLTGSGETDGKRFSVVLTHSDGSGAGHSERVRLTGELDGSMLGGSFDNGVDRGAWVASRE